MKDAQAIKTINVLGNHKLVNNPEIIKVKSIKEKYLNQISFLNLTYDDEFLKLKINWVGKTSGYVVGIIDEKFYKLSVSDFVQWTMDELAKQKGVERKDVRNELYKELKNIAHVALDHIPQLFID